MSVGATSTSDNTYGLVSRLVADSQRTRRSLETLTTQASDGLVADTYAGIGTGASVTLALQPSITGMQSIQNGIDSATGRMQVAQTALGEIQKSAAGFLAQISNLNGLNPIDVDSVAATARTALANVATLLNTQDGGVYVFAGEDTGNPPVPNSDSITSSGFFTQIATAVAGLATNGASVTAASTLATAASNAPGTSPFSTYLSQPPGSLQAPVARLDGDRTVPVGLLASANGVATSSGTSTTGSHMRDLLRALATLGSLSSSQVGTPGFDGLVADTRDSLGGVVSAMAVDAGVLGNTQASLAADKSRLADTQTALAGQVAAVRDVDMAKTLSALSQTQTRLQASYQLIASLNALSLVKYL